jgi:hypothetical protein
MKMRQTRKVVWAVLGTTALLAGPARASILIHDYQLNGSFADGLGGPSLVPGGGTLGATGYAFDANQGLSLSNGLAAPDHYSIEIVFNFSELTSWRRIVDFKNRTSDTGLYNFQTSLQFYNVDTGPAAAFVPNVDARLIITRDDTTDLFVGYDRSGRVRRGQQHHSVFQR